MQDSLLLFHPLASTKGSAGSSGGKLLNLQSVRLMPAARGILTNMHGRNHFMSTHHQSLFIGGDWVKPSSSKRIEVFSAATEDLIGSVPEGGEADIDSAVAAARRALKDSVWATSTPAERGAALSRFADALEKRGARLAQAVSMQNGMPINTADQLESGYAVALMRYYAALAANLQIEESRPSPLGFNTVVRREPVGVVAAIVPWNVPVALSMTKIGPALAAGCTLVLKPSPGTVLDSYIVAEAAEEAELPPGEVECVHTPQPG